MITFNSLMSITKSKGLTWRELELLESGTLLNLLFPRDEHAWPDSLMMDFSPSYKTPGRIIRVILVFSVADPEFQCNIYPRILCDQYRRLQLFGSSGSGYRYTLLERYLNTIIRLFP